MIDAPKIAASALAEPGSADYPKHEALLDMRVVASGVEDVPRTVGDDARGRHREQDAEAGEERRSTTGRSGSTAGPR